MSYLGTREQAKADAKAADMQIDGLEPGSTSPVQNGSMDGSYQLKTEGKSEFTSERTRPRMVGNQGGQRREFPTEGVRKGSL